MDDPERTRLRERLDDVPEWAMPVVGNADVQDLLDTLDFTKAERDVARAEAARLREALVALSRATEDLQFAIREGFEDHIWNEGIAGNLLDDAMLDCDEALGAADGARAALVATTTEEQ